MKKFLAIVVAAVLMISTLAMMPLSTSANQAEGGVPTSFMFGDTEVSLSLVTDYTGMTQTTDGFLECQANPIISGTDHSVQFLSGSWVGCDLYAHQLGAEIENPVMTGAKNIVFSVQNYSDGDVYFCMSPKNDSDNLFMQPNTDTPVLLVDYDGYMEESTPTADTSVCSGRYGWTIPELFEGYVIVPVSLFCVLGEWNTSAYGADPIIKGVGFHFASDISTYIEVYVDDILHCGDLPEYIEPGAGETEAPETEPEAPETEPEANPNFPVIPETNENEGNEDEETEPETAPETGAGEVNGGKEDAAESDTTADEDTSEDDKKDDDEDKDDDKKKDDGGCASVVAVAAALPVILGGAVLVINRKHDEE